MGIVVNFILHRDYCDASDVKSDDAAAEPQVVHIDTKFTFKGTSLTNHFRTDGYTEWLKTLSLTVFC